MNEDTDWAPMSAFEAAERIETEPLTTSRRRRNAVMDLVALVGLLGLLLALVCVSMMLGLGLGSGVWVHNGVTLLGVLGAVAAVAAASILATVDGNERA